MRFARAFATFAVDVNQISVHQSNQFPGSCIDCCDGIEAARIGALGRHERSAELAGQVRSLRLQRRLASVTYVIAVLLHGLAKRGSVAPAECRDYGYPQIFVSS